MTPLEHVSGLHNDLRRIAGSQLVGTYLIHVRTFHEAWDDPLPGTEFGEVEYALTRAEWQASGGIDIHDAAPVPRDDARE